jgi:hypothetical protein
MVEREGRIVAGPVPDTTTATLEPLVMKYVAPGTTLSTDEACAHGDLRLDLEREPINPEAWANVRRGAHSGLKSGIAQGPKTTP